MRKQPEPQKLVDVPADVFEAYLEAVGRHFASLGQKPTQVDLQTRLTKAAADVKVDGPLANILALRYALFVSLVTGLEAKLVERNLMVQVEGKPPTFSRSLVAATARLPCRFSPATGYVYSEEMLWKLATAARQAGVDNVTP